MLPRTMYCTNIRKNVCLYLFQVRASYLFEHSDNMCERMMPILTNFLSFVGQKNGLVWVTNQCLLAYTLVLQLKIQSYNVLLPFPFRLHITFVWSQGIFILTKLIEKTYQHLQGQKISLDSLWNLVSYYVYFVL